MTADALAAARAYSSALQTGGVAMPGAGTETAGVGSEFVNALREAVDSTVQQGAQTEQVMQAAVAGQGNMVEVVTAIAETELAIQTMVSVRDRVISAYQEVINMPI